MSQTIQQLIDRQMKRWEIEHRASGVRTPRPCIALSRFPGSGTAALGLAVAKRLDFEFFGTEIVERMAQEHGLHRKMAEAFDEHVRNEIDRYVVDAFRSGSFLESDYLQALLRTLRGISEGGGAVLLGRGSAHVLPPERTLRVLVVAPREDRVKRLAETRNVFPADAEAQLDHDDEERRRFMQHHFRTDPDDPLLYDVAVNTGSLTIDQATEVVLAAFRARFPKDPAAAPA